MSRAATLCQDTSMRDALVGLMRSANAAIMAVYGSDGVVVSQKSDDSPVTEADLAAHRVLVEGLARLTPEIPVVSEEDPESVRLRQTHAVYWLVDPLDGTKEFIKRNGEFTCNLALIEAHRATLGLVSVPADGRVYCGGRTLGAVRCDAAGQVSPVRCVPRERPTRVVASQSHMSPETSAYLADLSDDHVLVSVGSSLKFLMVAEGRADLYPRLAPTCEWDTAAAHAVLEGAGGRIETLESAPVVYGKESLLNPWFIARGLDA